MPVRKRLAAAVAVASGAVALIFAAVQAVVSFPRGALVLACVALALALGLHALTRRGVLRPLGVAAALTLLGLAVVSLVRREPVAVIVTVAAAAVSVASARAAFRLHVELPRAPRPRRPVLLYNPRSGGGKAERFRLRDEALARGIKPVELTSGADLAELARAEIAAGADALAMAGGDGSQATVAAITAEAGLPYACVPAGTRNHFALDLGVDRNDVVGALDAFVDGGERVVDLADVSGRVFVNNVSLGLYADAVQRAEYRDAKIRTLLDTIPDTAERAAAGTERRWRAAGGEARDAGVLMLVSNNRYRMGNAVGAGTRPRLDAAELGIVVLGAPAVRPAWQEWTAPSVTVEGEGADDADVAAGIDGEAVQLSPPLEFHVRPAALRVRIARGHPGASPSALQPAQLWAGLRGLAGIAAGRRPR